jgi:hypothetical protein
MRDPARLQERPWLSRVEVVTPTRWTRANWWLRQDSENPFCGIGGSFENIWQA